jgi:hypothetical protein
MIQNSLGLFYSPPFVVFFSFFLSIVFIFILATAQIAYTAIICIIYLASSSLFAKEIIDKIIQTIRTWFPETLEQIEKNLKKTFILHRKSESVDGLYIWHPHGLFASAPYIHNCLALGQGSQKMELASISLFHRFPIVRDIAKYIGLISASYDSIKTSLEQHSVALVVGGVEEMFHAEPKEIQLILKKRSGFLRLALETKKPLIPVITYAENELFTNLKDYTNSSLNKGLKRWLGIIIPISSLESVLKWSELKDNPLGEVHTYVGDPVYVEEGDTLESLKKKYVDALKKLFETTKPEGYTLEIL